MNYIFNLTKKSTVFLLLFFIIVVGSIIFPPAEWVPAQLWGEKLRSAGVPGVVLFWLVGMLVTSVGFPRQLLAFIGGIGFGAFFGGLISLAAATAGCFLTVLLSRYLLASRVRYKYPSMVEKLQKHLKNDVFIKVLILRLQPLGTNLVTNLCAGILSVSLPLFMAASIVGYVPQMLVFSLLGAGVSVGSTTQLLVSGVLMLVSLMLGGWLFRQHKARSLG